MKDISKSPARRSDGFHRYLKPGALAQIRNSRINARSTTSLVSRSSLSQLVDPISPSENSVDEAAAASRNLTIDQVPHLLRKIYGPYSYQRKKLAAARSVSSMMMMNINPPINSVLVEPSSDVIAHWVKLVSTKSVIWWYNSGKMFNTIIRLTIWIIKLSINCVFSIDEFIFVNLMFVLIWYLTIWIWL